MKRILHSLSLLLITSGIHFNAQAQCDNQVMHGSGTVTVASTAVTVTSSGDVDVNNNYCPSTAPYFIGYNYTTGTSLSGSYTFTFNPPVSAVTLNFSGLSDDATNKEIVVLTVNNSHYSVSSAGTANGCDQMAVVTPSGDIGGCTNCSVSGWDGTTIQGPISSLTVMDSVISGAPNGGLFSLFICPGDQKTEIIETTSSLPQISVYPNPSSSAITITGAENGTPYSIIDIVGKVVLTGTVNSMPVDIRSLASGSYVIKVGDTVNLPLIKR